MPEGLVPKKPIPLETARRICREIRKKKSSKLFTQCWGCVKATKGMEERMCFFKPPEFRGCALVNRRFEEGGRPDVPGPPDRSDK